VSPAAKLGGFLLLLVVVFIGAYAAGTRIGPVAPGPAPSGTPSGTSSPAPARGGMGGMP
jgi:hypothetical protein